LKEVTINSIFKAGKVSLVRVLLLSMVTIAVIYLDAQDGVVHRFRERLSVVVYPLQWLVDAPVRLVNWVGHSVTYQQHLVRDNAKLRAHELLLQSKLQKVLVLQKQNVQLKQLLQTRAQITGKVKLSRILAIQLSPVLKQMIIAGGSDEHMYVGQPVLDGYGVMGQVISVSPLSSRVLMITDRHFSIPVQDYRNGLRLIASGVGDNDRMSLVNAMPSSDIKMGDVFVSSGYGLRFPIGYPVGVVTHIEKSRLGRFMDVSMTPSAHLNQTQLVLLVWPQQAKLKKTVMQQMNQPLTNK